MKQNPSAIIVSAIIFMALIFSPGAGLALLNINYYDFQEITALETEIIAVNNQLQSRVDSSRGKDRKIYKLMLRQSRRVLKQLESYITVISLAQGKFDKTDVYQRISYFVDASTDRFEYIVASLKRISTSKSLNPDMAATIDHLTDLANEAQFRISSFFYEEKKAE